MKEQAITKMVFLTTMLAVLLVVAACDKVTKPTSDNTPPTLRWTIYNYETGNSTNISGSGGPVSVQPGNHVRVTLVAEDPQGIHRIRLGGSAVHSCTSGDLGKGTTVDYVTDEQVLNPDSNNQVLTSIPLLRDVDLNWTCQSGYTYAGGTATLLGEGENYFSGVTNATLTLTRP